VTVPDGRAFSGQQSPVALTSTVCVAAPTTRVKSMRARLLHLKFDVGLDLGSKPDAAAFT